MKRIVASVGLVALGTSGLHADSTSSLTDPSTKPWSVSATLRGFYDDNINSVPGGSGALTIVNPTTGASTTYHRSGFGFEVSPAFSVVWPWEQTTLSLGYIYSFKDYQFKPLGNSDTVDMTHSFAVSLTHTFNELYSARVSDSFVIGQEPDFLRAGNTYSTFQRISGSNIRNFGDAAFDGKVTPLLGFEVGYANGYYNYAADGTVGVPSSPTYLASPGGFLNRMEQTVHLDSRWQLSPDTVGVIGYQFTDVNYYEDQTLLPTGTLPFNVVSNTRNQRGHYGYVGVDESFTPALTASVRVGARYTDYYNDPNASANVGPYAQLSLRWNYAYQSYAEVGFVHDRIATDLLGNGSNSGNGDLTLDSDTSSVYATLSHRLAPGLTGSINGQYQNSEYYGGQYNNQAENFYTFGANLDYKVNRFMSTQVGYNYDRLDSAIGRGFDRNRVYVGLTASY